MDYTVYSDLTTAESFALNEQLDALGVGGVVRWRGVQHEPGLPVPMQARDRRTAERVEDEIAALKRRDPGIDIAQPPGMPNTSRAIIAVASVLRAHPSRAAEFRNALFRAYWRDRVDLSVAAELQRIADAVSVPPFVELDHPDAVTLAESWEVEWSVERLGGVPRVIRGDGRILWGFRPRDEAAAFFGVA